MITMGTKVRAEVGAGVTAYRDRAMTGVGPGAGPPLGGEGGAARGTLPPIEAGVNTAMREATGQVQGRKPDLMMSIVYAADRLA
jgi:hypothetical protein